MFRPLRDQILIKPIERVKSQTLVVIDHEKSCVGDVIAVGPGKYDKKGNIQPMDVKVGQIIRYGGEDYLSFPEVYLKDEKYVIISEQDVVGVVEMEEQY